MANNLNVNLKASPGLVRLRRLLYLHSYWQSRQAVPVRRRALFARGAREPAVHAMARWSRAASFPQASSASLASSKYWPQLASPPRGDDGPGLRRAASTKVLGRSVFT